MSYKTLFLVLIALDLAYDLILRILAASRRGEPLPDAVRDIYDADEYNRWLDYSAKKRKLGAIEKIFDALVLTALFATDVFSAVLSRLPGGEIGKAVLLLVLFSALTTLLSVPFDWVREKRIEAEYGFSRTKTATFVRDEITGFLTGLVLNILLTPLALSWMYGKSVMVYLIPRIAKNLLIFPLEAVLLMAFMGVMIPVIRRMNLPLAEQPELKITWRHILVLGIMFLLSLLAVASYYWFFYVPKS